MKLNIGSTALMFGTFAAVVHIVWSLLVFLGFAKSYLDWMLGLHFLNNPFRVAPFNTITALILIATTFVLGYLVGWLFASVWNYLHKSR